MATDVFSRTTQVLAGVLPVDNATMNFAAADGSTFGVGMITQNAQISYQQTINRLFEIGTNNQYFVGGRTQGQVSLGRVVGARAVQVAFYTKYGDMCNATSNNINLTAGGGCSTSTTTAASTSNGTTKYGLQYCVITSIGISVQAQDMMVNESVQMMFVSMTTS